MTIHKSFANATSEHDDEPIVVGIGAKPASNPLMLVEFGTLLVSFTKPTTKIVRVTVDAGEETYTLLKLARGTTVFSVDLGVDFAGPDLHVRVSAPGPDVWSNLFLAYT